MERTIELGKVMRDIWSLFRRDMMVYVVGMIAVFVMSEITLGILMGPLMVGFIMVTLKNMRGERGTVGEIFSLGFSRFMPGLIATILLGLGIFVGSLVVVGGIIFMLYGMYTFHFIADKGMGALDALKASFGLFKKSWGISVVALFVGSQISSLGAIACYVGVLFTLPLYPIILTVIYKELIGEPMVVKD
jgi:uncharacterized membrane protein